MKDFKQDIRSTPNTKLSSTYLTSRYSAQLQQVELPQGSTINIGICEN